MHLNFIAPVGRTFFFNGKGNTMGIKAQTITAKNVVAGSQLIGGTAEDASVVLKATKDLPCGDIEAEQINATNVVAGFQWKAGTAPTDSDALRVELNALRKQMEQMLQTDSSMASADTNALKKELEVVDAEIRKPSPQRSTILDGLEKAGTVAERVAKTASKFKGLVPLVKALATAAGSIFIRGE